MKETSSAFFVKNYLTRKRLCGIISPIMLEQEPVAVAAGIRELSVGARQLPVNGEFLLLVADLKSEMRLL